MEATDDGQITPRGYTNLNSYVKNLRVLVFIPDRQTEKLIQGGLGNYVSPDKLITLINVSPDNNLMTIM